MSQPPSLGRRLLRGMVIAAALIALFLLGAGFFGAQVPLFDTFAHFRAHLALLLVVFGVALLLLRHVAIGGTALVAGGAGIAAVLSFMPPFSPAVSASQPGGLALNASASARYTLLQMNLRWNADDKAAALKLIGRVSPDILTLQEASRDWRPLLAALAPTYPYRFGCSDHHRFTDALILSRRPFAAGSEGVCGGDQRYAAQTIDLNGAKLTVVAQHLRWPWPGSQWRQVDVTSTQLKTLAKSQLPVLVAGDFNAAPWSASLARYAALSGTTIVDGIGPTWFFQPLTRWIAPYAGLPIDNILRSGAIDILDVTRQPATASDHLPLLVTFTLPLPPAIDDPKITVARKY